jgi:pimeloyl-ACP methyl ester carboxylesterase
MVDLPPVRRHLADDGTGIAYRVWGDPGAPVPVVLQHGFIADTFLNWVPNGVVAALVANGRTVVGVDARGHGRSDKPHDPARYGEARMSRDLRGVVDDLGATAYDLVGYSMGAIVALIAASEDRRVRRLVVGGVGAGVVELGGVDTRHLDRRVLADALEADDPTTVTSSEPVLGFVRFAEAVAGDKLAYAAQARAVHSTPIALDAITADALVLVGDADPLAVRPGLLAEALRGRLEVLSGDHLGVLGDPRFVPTLARFVGG